MAITKTILSQEVKNGITYGRLKVVIPTGDVLTLGTQYSLVAAPGAGYQIEAQSVVLVCGNGTAYATNTTLYVTNDTATLPHITSQQALLSNATARTLIGNFFTPAADTSTQIISNKALVVYVAGGNPTTGTFQITLYVDYRIISL